MQAIVVLGHRLRDDGALSRESLKRLDLGIELFNKFNADAIIFSGGVANPLAGVSEAKAMQKYAIYNRIPSHKIILEEKSLDTIGNAIFIKELIKKKFGNLFLVTSCYHMYRASFIFKVVFGEGYKLNFDYCASSEREGKFEDIKLNQAKTFFKGMNPRDDEELKRRILNHELYRKEAK